MVRHGYHASPSYDGIRFFPKGTKRDDMRLGEVTPTVTIPRRTLKLMAELVTSDQGALQAVLHYAKTGELISPMTAAVQAQSERAERENAILRDQMAKMRAQIEVLMNGKEPAGKIESLAPQKTDVETLILGALAKLDHEDDKQWNASDEPRVDVVQELVGDAVVVSRSLIKTAAPSYVRSKSK